MPLHFEMTNDSPVAREAERLMDNPHEAAQIVAEMYDNTSPSERSAIVALLNERGIHDPLSIEQYWRGLLLDIHLTLVEEDEAPFISRDGYDAGVVPPPAIEQPDGLS